MLVPTVGISAEVTFSGFATLGATYHSHDELRFRSTLLNKTRDNFTLASDSVIGGQLNVQIDPQWDFVTQVVIQDRADTDWSNYFEKAFIRFKPHRNWAVRAGRMHSNVYLLSDIRTVGYAYPWARPPLDFYSSSAVAASTDGVDIQYSRDIFSGFAKFSLTVGESQARLNGDSGRLRIDYEDIVTFSAEYSRGPWQLKASLSSSRSDNLQFDSFNQFTAVLATIPTSLWPEIPQLLEQFDPEGERANFASFGFKYDDLRWNIQAELGRYGADWLLFPSARFGYLSVGYYFDDLLPYVVLSGQSPEDEATCISAPTLPAGIPQELAFTINALAEIADASVTGPLIDQTTLSAGVRWDFANDWVMKFQIDHIDIDYPGSGAFGNNNPALEKTPHSMNVVHLGLSTVF
ncbi:hypothetical protein QTP81_17160 [Alteromonas sp. ASW11-36]|uniref:Porin n=1 Tax=Alteromonas arenosi TaxID=3055817 RepID=A0ABT7T1L5_9ALTE|nr:hypothetical protein [Alteromonas sp. ASW11-36]MDM7862340.1 hypothetical protein [Alteromonas sp. ASW11-36]